MLILFETPAGYALFKCKDKGKLSEVEDIHKEFETAEKANALIKLEAFHQYTDTTEAVAAATATIESKLDKGLKKFLKKSITGKDLKSALAVADVKLGSIIKEKLDIKCINDNSVNELMRGIRNQLSSLVQRDDNAMQAMTLGLAHSLSRYKLKFSPDKVDTMIVQAIGLLDELDKEINTYAMRSREWFGWHFPEMGKIVQDNVEYCKVVLKMKTRVQFQNLDFSDILAEDVEATLREVCEVSMGTEISDEDVENIGMLCTQVISMTEYRAELYEYLQKRMQAVAPNLTVMVGELVGARLISHAGSLMNLAKHPASTVQILGAEKALFRALKTKHDTPKYGLIYHASLIGQTAPKFKGKISRVLAAKTALAIRVDALGDNSEATIGYENRAKVEARMRQLEGGEGGVVATSNGGPKKHESNGGGASYNPDADSTMKKRKADDSDSDEEKPKKKKKAKKEDGEKKKKKKSDDEPKKKKAKKSDDGEKKKKKAKKSKD
jgi:nucleolar protein 58